MTDSQTLTALSLIVVLEMKAEPTFAGEGEEHASVVSEASVDAQVAHLLTSQQTAREQTAITSRTSFLSSIAQDLLACKKTGKAV